MREPNCITALNIKLFFVAQDDDGDYCPCDEVIRVVPPYTPGNDRDKAENAMEALTQEELLEELFTQLPQYADYPTIIKTRTLLSYDWDKFNPY